MISDSYTRVATGQPVSTPLNNRSLFQLTGSDRVRYLNGQITHDLTRLSEGQALYAAALTGKGRMVSDLFVGASTDSLWIDCPASRAEAVIERLEKFLIADDAELNEVTSAYRLRHYFNQTPEPRAGELVFKNPRFGWPGFDRWTPQPDLVSDQAELESLEPEVVESLRIEAMLGKWGAELDEMTLPQEGLLERHGLSYNKGCYVGQETVARIRSIGHVNKWLGFLELMEGADFLATCPRPLTDPESGGEAGHLTSVAFSPLLGKTVGLGIISRKFHQPEQLLRCGEGLWKITAAPRTLQTLF